MPAFVSSRRRYPSYWIRSAAMSSAGSIVAAPTTSRTCRIDRRTASRKPVNGHRSLVLRHFVRRVGANGSRDALVGIRMGVNDAPDPPMPKRLLPFIPPLPRAIAVTPEPEHVSVLAVPRSIPLCCPAFGRRSDRTHGHYERRLADLPWQGRSVCLRVRLRRLRCPHLLCPCRTFCEPRRRLPPRVPDARGGFRMFSVISASRSAGHPPRGWPTAWRSLPAHPRSCAWSGPGRCRSHRHVA